MNLINFKISRLAPKLKRITEGRKSKAKLNFVEKIHYFYMYAETKAISKNNSLTDEESLAEILKETDAYGEYEYDNQDIDKYIEIFNKHGINLEKVKDELQNQLNNVVNEMTSVGSEKYSELTEEEQKFVNEKELEKLNEKAEEISEKIDEIQTKQDFDIAAVNALQAEKTRRDVDSLLSDNSDDNEEIDITSIDEDNDVQQEIAPISDNNTFGFDEQLVNDLATDYNLIKANDGRLDLIASWIKWCKDNNKQNLDINPIDLYNKWIEEVFEMSDYGLASNAQNSIQFELEDIENAYKNNFLSVNDNEKESENDILSSLAQKYNLVRDENGKFDLYKSWMNWCRESKPEKGEPIELFNKWLNEVIPGEDYAVVTSPENCIPFDVTALGVAYKKLLSEGVFEEDTKENIEQTNETAQVESEMPQLETENVVEQSEVETDKNDLSQEKEDVQPQADESKEEKDQETKMIEEHQERVNQIYEKFSAGFALDFGKLFTEIQKEVNRYNTSLMAEMQKSVEELMKKANDEKVNILEQKKAVEEDRDSYKDNYEKTLKVVANKEEVIANKDDEIARLKAELANKNSEIDKLNDDIAEKDKTIISRDETIKANQKVISDLKITVVTMARNVGQEYLKEIPTNSVIEQQELNEGQKVK